MIPQLIIIGLYLVKLGYKIAMHNKQIEGKHNAASYFIMMIIVFVLFGLGGFFDSFFN